MKKQTLNRVGLSDDNSQVPLFNDQLDKQICQWQQQLLLANKFKAPSFLTSCASEFNCHDHLYQMLNMGLFSIQQLQQYIEFFKSQNSETTSTTSKMISPYEQKSGAIKASYRELGRDFQVEQWLGEKRVARETVASDLAKIRKKLRAYC